MKKIKTHQVKAFMLLLASTALVTACAKKEIDDLPPVADGTQGAGNNGQGNNPNAVIPGSQQDFLNSVGIGNDRIFFDTDRFNIDSRDQVTLQGQAQWLGRYPGAQVVIEGHADERGTRDYNLALGERRANSAKNFLISLGIGASRIRTVSYGKERPDALGSNEQAWGRNRRAVTVIVQ